MRRRSSGWLVATYQSVLGRRQSGMDELFRTVAQHLRRRRNDRPNSPSRLRSTSSRNAAISRTTAPPPRSGSWWSRPRNPRPRDQGLTATSCGCRCSSATARRSISSFEREISAAQARAILREAPGVMLVDNRKTAAMSRRSNASAICDFRQPGREDPTVDSGAVAVGGERQSAQGAALETRSRSQLLGRKHLQKAA